MIKTKKKEEEKTQVENQMAQEKHELEKKALEESLDWRCDYCGNLNKPEKSKCDNCGAGKN